MVFLLLVWLALFHETGSAVSRPLASMPERIAVKNAAENPGWPTVLAGAQVRRDPGNGTLRSLKGPDLTAFLAGDVAFRRLVDAGRWREASLHFLSALGPFLRLDDPAQEFAAGDVTKDELGFCHVKLLQHYAGLPVWGAAILVHWNSAGAVYRVGGDYLPTPVGLVVRPAISAAEALKVAEATVAVSCPDCAPELGVFRKADLEPVLAYRLSLPAGIAQVWKIVVDARTGAVLEKIKAPR